ncbi:MAG: hypothetical protein M1832_005006 [Thelocarpon impressellum]|nr:MAG: hypothetical protein M1832_005006 [Thelocarpon impressellum]
MYLASALRHALLVLLPLAIASTVYLYLYPVFHGCAFPAPEGSRFSSFLGLLRQHGGHDAKSTSAVAPFRLLALGDPQLEGDTSLPEGIDSGFPSLEKLFEVSGDGARLIETAHSNLLSILTKDLPRTLGAVRKRIDLLGNDYYLAHIYRTLRWWSRPTHTTVLGDLLGSQWIDDAEFSWRGRRFWERVVRGGQRVEDDVTGGGREDLGEDPRWESRIINVAGNHDIGYAGDMTGRRVDRFEQAFGKANWDIRFRYPRETGGNGSAASEPELRLVILNSLNLETPAVDPKLQSQTYDFINDLIQRLSPVGDHSVATILLTHLPLHKEAGICVDGPYIAYQDAMYGSGVQEQNHLSPGAGQNILEGLFGMSGRPDAPARGFGRPGIILTGHDHEGCDTYHYLSDEGAQGGIWDATRWADRPSFKSAPRPAIREITVRSMMGSFGGNAGLLSAWWDAAAQEWRFEYASCALGVQHVWWAVHALDLITLCVAVAALAARMRDPNDTTKTLGPDKKVRSVHRETVHKVDPGAAVVSGAKARDSASRAARKRRAKR